MEKTTKVCLNDEVMTMERERERDPTAGRKEGEREDPIVLVPHN